MRKVIVVAGLALLVASCSKTNAEYATLRSNEYQIAGHPWKSAKDCARRKPIGSFDPRCDIPVVGFRGGSDFAGPSIGGGFAGGGMGGM